MFKKHVDTVHTVCVFVFVCARMCDLCCTFCLLFALSILLQSLLFPLPTTKYSSIAENKIKTLTCKIRKK